MHSFVRNLITEWRRLDLPVKGETLVVAVSGGADSVSLLLGIDDLVKRKKLGHRVVAAHFNHGFRGVESDGDEEFVRDLTTRHGLELVIGRGRVAAEGNLEQNARDARYQFLRQTAANLKAFAVVTAHTVNDQAETFLLNLIRGSGPDGLGGMRAVRDLEVENGKKGERETVRRREGESQGFNDDITSSPLLPISSSSVVLARPLLTWAKRTDTEGFCHDSRVDYRYDTMNEDTAFRRVRIRKILLPLLEDMNPKIVDTLGNTASLIQNLPAATGNHLPPGNALILGEIRTLERDVLYETIRKWLRQHRGNTRQLQLKHIQAIERLVFSEKSGRIAELPGGSVTKTGGKLVYEENKVEN